MGFLGLTLPKKFNGPVMKPMAPFFAAAIVIAYGVNAAQTGLMNSAEFKNDPRNPNSKAGH